MNQKLTCALIGIAGLLASCAAIGYSVKMAWLQSVNIFRRYTLLGAVISVATACTNQSNLPGKGPFTNNAGELTPGLTCPVMTNVEYNHNRSTTMLGPSPENPLICLIKRRDGMTQSLILNWYAVDRLRPVDVAHGIEVITSLLTGPVGFTTEWNRFFLYASFPYVSQFTVAPDQSITVGDKRYDVRVIRSKNPPYEDGETWIDKESLLILKYVDNVYPSKSYTVTAMAKAPAS